MDHDPLSEKIRTQDSTLRITPPAAVWERVDATLTEASPAPRRAARPRWGYVLAMAASVALLLAVAFLLRSRDGRIDPGPAAQAAAAAAPDPSEAVTLDLDAAPTPVLPPSTYEGVIIREGIVGQDLLKVCSPC